MLPASGTSPPNGGRVVLEEEVKTPVQSSTVSVTFIEEPVGLQRNTPHSDERG